MRLPFFYHVTQQRNVDSKNNGTVLINSIISLIMKQDLCSFLLLFILLPAATAYGQTLRVVTLYSPPIAYETGKEVTGIGVDLVREGLARMGHEAEISIMPWKRAVFMARFGEADAIFYLVKNEERQQWFHYPEEHLVNETTVLLKRAGEILDISLKPKKYPNIRLGIGRGYYYGPKLKKFLKNSTFESVEEATTIETNFVKLLEKRIDMFLADQLLADHFIKKRASQNLVTTITNKDGSPFVLDSVKSYLAFSKETMSQEMAATFSDVLKEMRKDGTYEDIVNKYR